MSTITTKDGTQIFYKDWGPRDAQPIVFHHGWPLSADDWDTQMLYLPRARAIASSPTTGAATAGRARSATATTWTTTPPTPPPSSSTSTCATPSTSATRPAAARRPDYVARHGQGPRRQARADRRRAAAHAEDAGQSRRPARRRCSTDCGSSSPPTARSSISTSPSGPFYGYNRPGAKRLARRDPKLVAPGA